MTLATKHFVGWLFSNYNNYANISNYNLKITVNIDFLTQFNLCKTPLSSYAVISVHKPDIS